MVLGKEGAADMMLCRRLTRFASHNQRDRLGSDRGSGTGCTVAGALGPKSLHHHPSQVSDDGASFALSCIQTL